MKKFEEVKFVSGFLRIYFAKKNMYGMMIPRNDLGGNVYEICM